jgi:hypothetical protein
MFNERENPPRLEPAGGIQRATEEQVAPPGNADLRQGAELVVLSLVLFALTPRLFPCRPPDHERMAGEVATLTRGGLDGALAHLGRLSAGPGDPIDHVACWASEPFEPPSGG